MPLDQGITGAPPPTSIAPPAGGSTVRTVAEEVMVAAADVGYPLLCGLPGGGTSLDLIEASQQAGSRFLPTATESGSVIIAATIGDLTGRAAVVTTTLGPGVTSAVNGIASASLDRQPVLVVSDGYDPSERERFQRQHIDVASLLAPITKGAFELTAENPAATVREALALAQQVPAGPVQLTLPASSAGRLSIDAGNGRAALLPTPSHSSTDEAALSRAADLFAGSTRPVLLAGAEARADAAAAALRRLAEAVAAPVLTTYRGKGTLPDDHPLAAGLFTNGALEQELLASCDLIVGVGLDPVELLARDWQFDAPYLDLREASGARPPTRPAASALGQLDRALDFLAEAGKPAPLSWTAQAAIARRRAGEALRKATADAHQGAGLAPTRVVEIARQTAPPDTLVTMDSGAHMLPVAALWQSFEPRSFFCSSGLATMGFALPAAIGLAVASPSRPVLAFVGDAGLLMSAPELGTLAGLAATVVVLVFADRSLSLIELKVGQRSLPAGALATPAVNWQTLAESFGLPATTASNEHALEDALAAALRRPGPSMVVATVDPSSYGRIAQVFRG